MIDALISGKLIRDTVLKTSTNGSSYCQFLLSVFTGESESTIVSGIAFGEVAERIAKLNKGDPLAVIGGLKPTEWNDKSTGETKHGLNITANNSLSPYDIKKRKPAQDSKSVRQDTKGQANHFNDDIPF